MYAKFYHNIPLSSRDSAIITFSEFGARQSLYQWRCHFAISWSRSCQYQCLRNSLSKYSSQLKRWDHFHFFRIWRSAKPRPMINVILQSLELDLVNINVSARFYQNIPNGFRIKFHCFQNLNLGKKLDQSQMSFDYLVGYILSISMCMQNFITIFHSVQETGPFSLFQNLEPLRKRLRIRSVISVNYHYITVLCPVNILIRFKCYNIV